MIPRPAAESTAATAAVEVVRPLTDMGWAPSASALFRKGPTVRGVVTHWGSSACAPLGRVFVLMEPMGAHGLELVSFSNSGTSATQAHRSPRSPRPPAPEVPDMLAEVRTAFGFNLSQMARGLRVERPTVYSWIRHQATPRRHNLERIHELWRLANVWLGLVGRPIGDALRTPGVDGQSVEDLLTSDPLRAVAVEQQLRALADQYDRSVGHRKGLGGREAAQQLGLQHAVAGYLDRVSFETGQPLGQAQY